MKIVPYDVKSGQDNMQTDFDLLEKAVCKHYAEPIFRLYGWAPACVSLGRNQKDDFLDYNLLKAENIDVVRRLTGGRALLHDNEITYSFICPVNYLKNGQNVKDSYKEISQILIDGFQTLGIDLTFGNEKEIHTKFDYCMLVSTGADLCYNGKKFIGSAQCRKQGYILQHGSILYDYNKELLEEIFKEPVDSGTIISVKEINPNISQKDIITALLRSVKIL